MLYKFSRLVQDFNIHPKGVLHIGANTGQEVEEYYNNGVKRTVWIEADPAIMGDLKKHIAAFPNAIAFNECCHMINGKEETLNISSNGSESSSILKFGTHSEKHPDVTFVGETPVKTKTVKRIFEENKLQFQDYEFVNIDVQGVEWLVLKGFGSEAFKHIRYVYVEVNKEELYVGCSRYEQVDELLKELGFTQKFVEWAGTAGWGDAFYIKEETNSNVITENMLGAVPKEVGFAANAFNSPLPPPATNQSNVYPFKPDAQLKTLSAEEMHFSVLAKKRGLDIRGIINAGAYIGNDIIQYKELKVKNIMMIEPNPEAFQIMQRNFENEAIFKNIALTESNGSVNIYQSTGDNGKSNSILYPKVYLTQYSDIKFQGHWNVMGQSLDSLGIDAGKYNMLHLDLNGYEFNALKGGLTFLHTCSYIYMKVYYADLWEKCVHLKEVKAFLEQLNFGLVDVSKEGITWGYALFIKKDDIAYPVQKAEQPAFEDAKPEQLRNDYLDATPGNEFVVDVPRAFRPHISKPFPADNVIPFEEWFYASFNFGDNVKGKMYLPVFWNSYYSNFDIENSPGRKQDLQNWLNALDTSKEYFTICMYPKGILNDISHLKITVIGINPSNSTVILPVVCLPHQYEFKNIEKDIFISYVGSHLHPVRRKLYELLPKDHPKIYLNDGDLTLEEYCNVLARSRYVMCPVGFKGLNFRVAEALQYGAVPILFNSDRDILFNGYKNSKLDFILQASGLPTLIACINQQEIDDGYFAIDEKMQISSTLALKSLVEYKTLFDYKNCKLNIIKAHFNQ